MKTLKINDMTRWKSIYGTILLVVILIAISCLSLYQGTYKLTWQTCKEIFFINPKNELPSQIFLYVRLPRLILALITGATFGAVGTALQALFRNPLADPSLIGVTGGAASGAALAIVCIAPMIKQNVPTLSATLSIQFIAFLFALFTVHITYQISIKHKYQVISKMLLAGIAINALSGSLFALLSYIANDHALRLLTLWNLGGFSQASWNNLYWVTPPCIFAIFGLLKISSQLTLLQLGHKEANYLGLHVTYLTKKIFFLSAISISMLIAHIGIVSFLGIISPHCGRVLFGHNCRRTMPNTILLGALIAIIADLCARTLLAPFEIPLSIVTSLIGAPFFLYLLVYK